MRFSAFALTCASLAALASHAHAGVLYTTTDLGAGYSLKSNADGHTYGVADASGGVVYAFDKSPVTVLDKIISQGQPHADSYIKLTLQSGDHQVGYAFDYLGGYSSNHPTFEPYSNGWQVLNYDASPVLDINTTGQVVGTSDNIVVGSTQALRYAGFSDVNGQSHGFAAQTVDNLNNYITPIAGVDLDSAFKIDDLGRILALGSNGHDYLLTPIALGAPSAVPEPASWLLLGVFATAATLGHRPRRPATRAPGPGPRRLRRREGASRVVGAGGGCRKIRHPDPYRWAWRRTIA